MTVSTRSTVLLAFTEIKATRNVDEQPVASRGLKILVGAPSFRVDCVNKLVLTFSMLFSQQFYAVDH